MRKTFAIASRNLKELVRDPLTTIFCVGMPVGLLVIMSFIQQAIPAEAQGGTTFAIEKLAPGMVAFGLSFISLFTGTLIAKDRGSSFLTRLFASPLSAFDYIMGYALPIIPVAAAQVIVCMVTALFFGLKVGVYWLTMFLLSLPIALLYIAMGVLFGVIFNDKAVSGICSLIVNVAALISGTWFELSMLSKNFSDVCYCLPFANAVDMLRAAVSGNYDGVLINVAWVLGYAAVIFVIGIILFNKRMKGN